MQQKDLVFLILSISIFLIIFIVGSFLYLLQYRKRKIEGIKENKKIKTIHQQAMIELKLEIQKQTMQQIGREIHDNVGQKLTLASLYTQQILHNDTEILLSKKVESINSLINESLIELRNLSRTLTYEYLEKETLKNLLDAEIAKMNNLPFTIDYKVDIITIHSNTVKTVLVRVLQEFFNNTIKYANATKVTIRVQDEHKELYFLLQDNGCGFVANETNTAGIGLSNMQKRVTIIGGTYSLVTSPNNGTKIEIYIPHEKL